MKGWTMVAFGLIGLLNLVLLSAVIAMAAKPSVARSVASPLHLATASEVANLDSRTSDLEVAIADTLGLDDLASRVDDLESRLDDLETGAGDQAAESVDDLSSRVDDLEFQVSDVESQVSDLQAQVDDVSSRVQEVEDVLFNLCFELDFVSSC